MTSGTNPDALETHLTEADRASERLSPLLMITSDPVVNAFIGELSAARERLMSAPEKQHVLHFQRQQIREVREAYARTVRAGEATLHRFCELLGAAWFESEFSLQTVVIGEIAATNERFKFMQPISREELYLRTDLDLGNRQLERLFFRQDDGTMSSARLISNSVEYQPLVRNYLGIHKMISRIKAEEELWNKVCDEIFGIDLMVQRDKELRRLSRYIKDVFGIKILVEEREEARAILEDLRGLAWDDGTLERHQIEPGELTRAPRIVEVKDYLQTRKLSGWGALKIVLQWGGKTIEVQVQTADAYHRELLYLTNESHAGHKERREKLRSQIASTLPLFSFYLDLLQWLFVDSGMAPPALPNVRVEVAE